MQIRDDEIQKQLKTAVIDGANETNRIFCFLFQLDLGLNVYPRKSNDVLGYLFLRLSSLQ